MYDDENKFIIYDSNMLGDKTGFNNKTVDKKALYCGVVKRQKRNAIILSISIFLYFVSFSWLTGTMDYFDNKGYNILYFGIFFGLVSISTILFVISQLTKSKDGKILYKYKDEKYFYFSLLFMGIVFFKMFVTLPKESDSLWFVTFFTSLGAAFAFYTYYKKSCGKKKSPIKKWMESVIIILFLSACALTGYFLNLKLEGKVSESSYAKNSIVAYDKGNSAYLIARVDKIW